MQGLSASLVAQGRQKEAAEFLQGQQQALEGSASAGKVGAVELQLLLGKVTSDLAYLSMLLTFQPCMLWKACHHESCLART